MALNSNEEDEHKLNDDVGDIDITKVRKTLYCLRHAQSLYNESIRTPKTWMNYEFWLNGFDPKIRDPLLSNKGEKQTEKMCNILKKCSFLSSFNIDLIVTSPLKRAIDTLHGVLPTIGNENNSKIIANPQLREWIDTLGDIGTPKSKLMQIYSNQNIDFSFIQNEYWWDNNYHQEKENKNDIKIKKETKKHVHDRISAFKHWILQREENNILIIGHSRWFREFVGSTFKLNNCAMMKVNLHGMNIESWEYIDFDEIQQNKEKIDNIIHDSKIKKNSESAPL